MFRAVQYVPTDVGGRVRTRLILLSDNSMHDRQVRTSCRCCCVLVRSVLADRLNEYDTATAISCAE
jgi:hypothetical protein